MIKTKKPPQSSSLSKIPHSFNLHSGPSLGVGSFCRINDPLPVLPFCHGGRVPYTWLVPMCRPFCADCKYGNCTATRWQRCLPLFNQYHCSKKYYIICIPRTISWLCDKLIWSLSSRETFDECQASAEISSGSQLSRSPSDASSCSKARCQPWMSQHNELAFNNWNFIALFDVILC